MSMKTLSAFALAPLLALIIAACTGGDPTSTVAPEPTATPVPTPTPPARSIPQIIIALSPSIVHIQTESVRLDQFNKPAPGRGVGTGQIIDDKGHVLTN